MAAEEVVQVGGGGGGNVLPSRPRLVSAVSPACTFVHERNRDRDRGGFRKRTVVNKKIETGGKYVLRSTPFSGLPRNTEVNHSYHGWCRTRLDLTRFDEHGYAADWCCSRKGG